MTDTKADLILHPVRMRILITISDRQMTVQDLARALPDVAQATLYRHINTLAEGGLLSVVEERPVRGTLERLYVLTDANALSLSEEDLREASKEDHQRYFTTFLATMMADFGQYLQSREEIRPGEDGLGYHTYGLYLSDEEMQSFAEGLRALMKTYAKPKPGRKRRQMSIVLIPSDDGKE